MLFNKSSATAGNGIDDCNVARALHLTSTGTPFSWADLDPIYNKATIFCSNTQTKKRHLFRHLTTIHQRYTQIHNP